MHYDVIVVGAGSAGCPLAARLSEEPKRSVLLLEAGPDYPHFESLPDDLKWGANWAYVMGGPHVWDYVATATPHQSRPMLVPRGKVVGGSSAINGQIFIRGLPEDYDGWAEVGNDEWAFHKVLPYFLRMERDLDFGGDFHGSDGPIPVRRYRREELQPVQEAFYRACRALGFPEDADANLPDSTGVGPRPLNNVDGVRISMALAYLDPARHRLNLTIRGNVLARRILFEGKRAVGVEVESGGETFTVEGSQIILCGGAIGSPQVLMLSGVGPGEHLRSLGIPVVHHLPGVGQTLRDHPGVPLRFRVKEGYVLNPDVPLFQVALRYTTEGSPTRNDMTLIPLAVVGGEEYASTEPVGIGIIPRLDNPRTAGELRLVSANPHDYPSLDYRYLSDPYDRARMRQAVRLVLRLTEHEAYRDIIAGRMSPKDQDLASDDALDAWLLANAVTCHHSAGTCKMGPASDPLAVVDQYGWVHGLRGLRVVDASIMPEEVRANINATVIMMAERAADWVKEGR